MGSRNNVGFKASEGGVHNVILGMFSSSRSEPTSSSLSLAHAIDEIRNSSTVPFNVDDLIKTHGISLSSSAQGNTLLHSSQWPLLTFSYWWIEQWGAPRKQDSNGVVAKETLKQLKEAATSDESPHVYDQARVWVDEYLQSVQSLGTWADDASQQINQVQIARDTLKDIITKIEEHIPHK